MSPFFFLSPLSNIIIEIIIIKTKIIQWVEQGSAIRLGVKLVVTFTFCKQYLTEALGLWLMRHPEKNGEEVFDATLPRAVLFQWGLVNVGGGTILPKEGISQAFQILISDYISIVSAPNCFTHSFSVQGWHSPMFRDNWGSYAFPIKPFIPYHCYFFERTVWCIHSGVVYVKPSQSMHLSHCIIPFVCFQTVLTPPRALSSLILNFGT